MVDVCGRGKWFLVRDSISRSSCGLKFNPVDKSMKSIGPDLGFKKWMCGVPAKNGCMYCAPCYQGDVSRFMV